MADYTELCEILRTKLHGTIRLEDGLIQLADIVAADVIETMQSHIKHLDKMLGYWSDEVKELQAVIQQEREEHAETYKNLRSTYIKANEQEKAENERLKKKLDAAVADIYILIGKYPNIKCSDVCNGECLDCYSSVTKTLRGFKWRGED